MFWFITGVAITVVVQQVWKRKIRPSLLSGVPRLRDK